MARTSENPSDQIYAAAAAFRDRCLLQDGSLLFPGESIWSLANLEQIKRVFVDNLDTSDRSFTEKFHDQIGSQDRRVVVLGAELLSIYFLFPSNVTGRRKQELVGEVLGWTQETLPPGSIAALAFENGIGSGGQGYNTRRPFEIEFLIRFALRWKGLSSAEQAHLANSPWDFLTFIDKCDEGAEGKQLRHILIHLLFPDHFERIASRGNKQSILRAFSGLEGNADNDEHALLNIRERLTQLIRPLPKDGLDFYRSPLAEAWIGYDASDEEGLSLELIRYKKQVVLYGPPGTGKTYTARKLAERIIRTEALHEWGAERYFTEEAAISAAALGGNVRHLQLHPAYSYEDFIRSLHIGANGSTEYRKGTLLQLLDEMAAKRNDNSLPYVLILDEMNRTDLSRMLGECFSLLENRDQEVTLPGTNANGKSMTMKIPPNLYVIGTMNLIDQSVEQIDFALRRRFLWQYCPFNKSALLAAAEHNWQRAGTTIDWQRVEADFQRLAESAERLNQHIRDSPHLGPQYEIGHTYLLDAIVFLMADIGTGSRGNKRLFLWESNGQARTAVKQVWRLSLMPLLEQYMAGLDATTRNQELDRLASIFLTAPRLP